MINLGSSSAELDALIAAQPRTKEDFQKLSTSIIEFIIKRHESKPLYPSFVEHFARALALPLKDVEVRKVASGLTTLANEKQKEQRDKASGKKKPKAASKPGLGGTKVSSRCVFILNSFKPLILLFNALLVLWLIHNIPGLIQALTRKLWMTLETTISCKDVVLVLLSLTYINAHGGL